VEVTVGPPVKDTLVVEFTLVLWMMFCTTSMLLILKSWLLVKRTTWETVVVTFP